MPNITSAKKRARQTEVRNERNRSARSRTRTFVKKLETTIVAGEKDQITAQFKTTMSELHKAASKGLIKKKTASRKISRLAAQVRNMEAAK